MTIKLRPGQCEKIRKWRRLASWRMVAWLAYGSFGYQLQLDDWDKCPDSQIIGKELCEIADKYFGANQHDWKAEIGGQDD